MDTYYRCIVPGNHLGRRLCIIRTRFTLGSFATFFRRIFSPHFFAIISSAAKNSGQAGELSSIGKEAGLASTTSCCNDTAHRAILSQKAKRGEGNFPQSTHSLGAQYQVCAPARPSPVRPVAVHRRSTRCLIR